MRSPSPIIGLFAPAAPRIADKLTDTPPSWEIGTLAEALTELECSGLGVFSPYSIPPPATLSPGEAVDILSIAER